MEQRGLATAEDRIQLGIASAAHFIMVVETRLPLPEQDPRLLQPRRSYLWRCPSSHKYWCLGYYRTSQSVDRKYSGAGSMREILETAPQWCSFIVSGGPVLCDDAVVAFKRPSQARTIWKMHWIHSCGQPWDWGLTHDHRRTDIRVWVWRDLCLCQSWRTSKGGMSSRERNHEKNSDPDAVVYPLLGGTLCAGELPYITKGLDLWVWGAHSRRSRRCQRPFLQTLRPGGHQRHPHFCPFAGDRDKLEGL